jgi:hypothetical protein
VDNERYATDHPSEPVAVSIRNDAEDFEWSDDDLDAADGMRMMVDPPGPEGVGVIVSE